MTENADIKITFIGTGEAFDPLRANTSYLIQSNNKSILIDCGYDVPKSLMRYLESRNQSVADIPDSVIFTHEHGDHMAGFPALLMSIWEEINGVVGNRNDGLKRKLSVIFAYSKIKNIVRSSMISDYSGFLEKFKKEGPDISYRLLLEPDELIDGVKINFAPTSHGAVNFAYKFEYPNGKSFAISGDGALTEESKMLYAGVDLLLHEGFQVDGDAGVNHTTMRQVVDYAIKARISEVGIVHVNREQRKMNKKITQITRHARNNNVDLFFPNDHEEIVL